MLSMNAHALCFRLLTENAVQRLGATGAREVMCNPWKKAVVLLCNYDL